MYLATPTRAFFKASKDEEYNIFFLTFASSGHHDIKKSFSFFPYNEKLKVEVIGLWSNNKWCNLLPLGFPDTGGCTRSRRDRSDTPSQLHWQSSAFPRRIRSWTRDRLQNKRINSLEMSISIRGTSQYIHLSIQRRWTFHPWCRRRRIGNLSLSWFSQRPACKHQWP